MDSNNGTGPLRDGCFRGGYVDTVGIRGYIHENRNGTNECDGGSGGDKGVGWDDDLVPDTDASCLKRDLQGSCAAADSTTMFGLVDIREGSLEFSNPVTEKPAPGANHVE